jgi:hypothetical protein
VFVKQATEHEMHDLNKAISSVAEDSQSDEDDSEHLPPDSMHDSERETRFVQRPYRRSSVSILAWLRMIVEDLLSHISDEKLRLSASFPSAEVSPLQRFQAREVNHHRKSSVFFISIIALYCLQLFFPNKVRFIFGVFSPDFFLHLFSSRSQVACTQLSSYFWFSFILVMWHCILLSGSVSFWRGRLPRLFHPRQPLLPLILSPSSLPIPA